MPRPDSPYSRMMFGRALKGYETPDRDEPTHNKQKLRSEVDSHIEEFLLNGGKINEVPVGLSGKTHMDKAHFKEDKRLKKSVGNCTMA